MGDNVIKYSVDYLGNTLEIGNIITFMAKHPRRLETGSVVGFTEKKIKIQYLRNDKVEHTMLVSNQILKQPLESELVVDSKVGKYCVFRSPKLSEALKQFDGSICFVTRELTPEENETDGRMYNVVIGAEEFHAFDDELIIFNRGLEQ